MIGPDGLGTAITLSTHRIDAADRITELLLAGRRHSLKPWRHSKLATGLALETLEREGKLADLLASAGWLTLGHADGLCWEGKGHAEV